jgi:hypothetical protein
LTFYSNPAPAALFEAGSGGFQIWCTPEDNPGELWSKVEMIAGAFSKPCEYVASAPWKWAEEGEPTIIGIALSTDAYALRDARLIKAGEGHNRPEDIAWAKRKIEWLWQASTAGARCRLLWWTRSKRSKTKGRSRIGTSPFFMTPWRPAPH